MCLRKFCAQTSKIPFTPAPFPIPWSCLSDAFDIQRHDIGASGHVPLDHGCINMVGSVSTACDGFRLCSSSGRSSSAVYIRHVALPCCAVPQHCYRRRIAHQTARDAWHRLCSLRLARWGRGSSVRGDFSTHSSSIR